MLQQNLGPRHAKSTIKTGAHSPSSIPKNSIYACIVWRWSTTSELIRKSSVVTSSMQRQKNLNGCECSTQSPIIKVAGIIVTILVLLWLFKFIWSDVATLMVSMSNEKFSCLLQPYMPLTLQGMRLYPNQVCVSTPTRYMSLPLSDTCLCPYQVCVTDIIRYGLCPCP